jgi:hypothetical protein
MIKYYHELTKDEVQGLIDKKYTYKQTEEDYPQPEWCSYPNATYGEIGCWSLLGYMVTSEDYCKDCDCYKKVRSERK